MFGTPDYRGTIAAMRAELAKVGGTRPSSEPPESHRSNATP